MPCLNCQFIYCAAAGREWLRNVEQLTYTKTSVKLVNKPAHGYFMTLLVSIGEQLLPLRSRLSIGEDCPADWNATVIPPFMEANAQQGIIYTSQLQSSATTVAQWGGGGGHRLSLKARELGCDMNMASSNAWSSCWNLEIKGEMSCQKE